jgi:hypothetical protein
MARCRCSSRDCRRQFRGSVNRLCASGLSAVGMAAAPIRAGEETSTSPAASRAARAVRGVEPAQWARDAQPTTPASAGDS